MTTMTARRCRSLVLHEIDRQEHDRRRARLEQLDSDAFVVTETRVGWADGWTPGKVFGAIAAVLTDQAKA